MAEKFDVAARLAEGRPAVDNIQTYVWACHELGYADKDLTLHASQVSDWYDSEDGLDLRALDADCAALEAAVAATEDALARQDDQLGALSAAWQGRSADLSRKFLRRHDAASAAAAAALRTTADALAALRDNLWHNVDGKVAAAITAEGRAPDDWLAAAHTVTTGAGDRAAASERIDQEVKPFVDNDIRADWLAAMRAAMAAVVDLYDAATAELTAEPEAVFDVPGELGPSWTPPRQDEVATIPAAASAVAPPVAAPPSWGAPAAPPPMPTPPMPAPPVPTPPPLPPVPPVDAGSTAPAMATPPSAPSLGGLPDVGSGLSGLGQQLADTFGSLLGSADEAFGDQSDIDGPDDDVDDKLDDDELDDDGADDDEPVDPAAEPEEEPSAEEPIEAPVDVAGTCEPAESPTAPVEPPPIEEPAPTPVPPPPPPELSPLSPPEPAQPPASPTADAETPCEIAADELPQVGQ
ncbi:MAG TPA: hypothetical protein VKA77_03795 [Mycobacterium sp.]|nr:hypothetical protein [Mycobacterium sp.]